MGDRLTKGLQELISKHGLPFVAFNQGSVCHLDSVGTMQYAIDWSKPWELPKILNGTHRCSIYGRRHSYTSRLKAVYECCIY